MAKKVVNGFTDILKNSYPEKPNSEIVNRISKFVDEISGISDDVLWKLSREDGLIFFLKELALRVLVSQIDEVFRCGPYKCPLVNQFLKYYET